jgi:hypothetical protein
MPPLGKYLNLAILKKLDYKLKMISAIKLTRHLIVNFLKITAIKIEVSGE